MRCEHRRPAPLERLELPEPVGVEHDRHVEPLEQDAHEVDGPVAPPEAGPERDGGRALGRLDDRVRRARQQPSGRVLRQRPLDGLEEARLQHRQRRLGRRDGDVARVRAERREGCQHRRAGQPARTADDEHRTGAVLRRRGLLAGDVRERRRRDERVLGPFRQAQADLRDVHRPGVELAGRDREPHLRGAERDGDRRAHRGAGDLAGRAVYPRGDVDRDDGPAGGVDALDHPPRILARRVAQADPEQRVDDHVGLAELAEAVDDGDVATGLAQHTCAHAPVTAVVPLPTDDGDAPREAPEHDLRHRGAGALHQLLHRAGVRLLRAPRLLRRQQRLQPHASTTTATAAASSRECVTLRGGTQGSPTNPLLLRSDSVTRPSPPAGQSPAPAAPVARRPRAPANASSTPRHEPRRSAPRRVRCGRTGTLPAWDGRGSRSPSR